MYKKKEREEIEKEIEGVKEEINKGSKKEYSIKTEMYEGEEGIELIKFKVKREGGCERKFSVRNSERLSEDIRENIEEVIRYYEGRERLSEKIEKLNKEIRVLLKESEVEYEVEFVQGDKLLEYASDREVRIGLNRGVIENIDYMTLFDKDELRSSNYKKAILDDLKKIDKGYELIKVKSVFTKDLEIYTRKSIYRLLKGSVRRKLESIREGDGYIDRGDVFSIIEKRRLKEKEGDFEYMEEVEGGYIGYRYKVRPINKEYGYEEEIEIKELIRGTV